MTVYVGVKEYWSFEELTNLETPLISSGSAASVAQPTKTRKVQHPPASFIM